MGARWIECFAPLAGHMEKRKMPHRGCVMRKPTTLVVFTDGSRVEAYKSTVVLVHSGAQSTFRRLPRHYPLSQVLPGDVITTPGAEEPRTVLRKDAM